jgi:drug/metabolite transporter (DMT)-like permease
VANISPHKSKLTQPSDFLALFCAFAAVLIWGWWMSATRVAANNGVAPIDVAFLRYSIPAVLLIPIWIPTVRKLHAAPKWALLAMLGWGAPFLWLVTASLENSNVIYLATIVPCTMPVFAFMAERLLFKFRPVRNHWVGFALIGFAALIIIARALLVGDDIDGFSVLMMLLAAMGWAGYVVAFKHTGLSVTQGATWVCVTSTLLIISVKIISGGSFLPMTTEQLIFNGVAQGLVSGFVAVILYTYAIARLGSARAASFSVLMPVFGAAFAWAWLGEQAIWQDLVALTLATIGVAIVNGVIRLR